MDIINNYEVIHYNQSNYSKYDKDKYTNENIYSKCTIHYMNGKIHRDNDLPAIIYTDGQQEWWVNGQLHRDNDKPAVIFADGSQYWYMNGKCHRDNDQPAIICTSGVKHWYVNGNFIRSIYT